MALEFPLMVVQPEPCFEELPDPRLDRGQNHLLIDMVALAFCGTICGADTWADIERFSLAHQQWFERFPTAFPRMTPLVESFAVWTLLSFSHVWANGASIFSFR